MIYLPEYPRTYHFYYKPNIQKGDSIYSKEECDIVFNSKNVVIEEKIDGASAGVCYLNDNFIIRNRKNTLKKGFLGKTPAKLQFASIFNWAHDNKDKFKKLLTYGDYSVYGEWMIAVHGMKYTNLPDWFVAYDLYDYSKREFINGQISIDILNEVGFSTVPILSNYVSSVDDLVKLTQCKSSFTDEKIEGIYIKVSDEKYITHRFKMIREGFIQGALWSHEKLTKNRLDKK